MQDTQELTEAPQRTDVDAAEDAPALPALSPAEGSATEGSGAEGAFEATGFKAAVFKPMFAHAHQQVFTPRWLCEALPPIAHHAFGFEGMIPEERPRLNVLDPTCGAAREKRSAGLSGRIIFLRFFLDEQNHAQEHQDQAAGQR